MLAFALAGPAVAEGKPAPCGAEVLWLKTEGGVQRLSVEIADDPDARAQGLMFRPSLPSAAGMLFVYEAPQRALFWMKNTLLPLDMIFADEKGVVLKVHEGAKPLDETPIDGGPGVALVLEINAGLSGALGITPGSLLRHPAIDQSGAAWPCAAN